MSDALALSRRALATHGKSFHLASRLLPRGTADRAAALYAFCRALDDAIDDASPGEERAALARARAAVDAAFGERPVDDPVIEAFRATARETGIPRAYADELVEGFAMDVAGARYADLGALLVYCYRVAGVVGLMMCHVLGVRDRAALRHAAHLGIAMQLTNICRDVAEDWDRGRLYLPDDLLRAAAAPPLPEPGARPFPDEARPAVVAVVERLLGEADRYYASADRGLAYLAPRASLAIRAARRLYAAIGDRLRLTGSDPLRGRAVVPTLARLALVARAIVSHALDALRARRPPFRAARLEAAPERFADVVPV